MLDERVDQFSDLVDNNMETLRKAIQDNREVFVNVINRSNEDIEKRQNGFVEDLEKVVTELFAIQTTVNSADQAVKGDSERLAKQVHDLEAHINTMVLTEKSSRRAQDGAMAEEIDKLNSAVLVVTDKL